MRQTYERLQTAIDRSGIDAKLSRHRRRQRGIGAIVVSDQWQRPGHLRDGSHGAAATRSRQLATSESSEFKTAMPSRGTCEIKRRLAAT